MSTAGVDGITTTNREPLSVKAACIGFVASTALMTLIMTLVGNFGG